jgi:hypothetical protein
MQIVIAPGRLKDGVTEEAMLAASDRFQREFVVDHPGVLRRVLVSDSSGRYADIVFFADEAAVEEVIAAEQSSEVCHQFMSLWDGEEPVVYRVVRTHD